MDSPLSTAYLNFNQSLLQADGWLHNIFGTKDVMDSFITQHRSVTEWTDAKGVMCQVHFILDLLLFLLLFQLLPLIIFLLLFILILMLLLPQATALVVGREIRLVGTANIGQPGPGYTTLESVLGAKQQEPFYVGYYQVLNKSN